ncbi:MAG: GTP pyrophosphokinase family protein [Lachnospiraceae bacterium]|nr:GTP pyrophosphokinase family protein [Lachnospiraceae bacterium]MBQ9563751.1 GTP pyrophosphokinase family protein [Lachnospiraceae bacterium]MBQ9592488.1 GTP pyrophosphokinase family protein [Lachnospiraceae bacterium]MBR0152676.1 GTP pyrophosphokinase family protein [Lachnospiraceae bacterium]
MEIMLWRELLEPYGMAVDELMLKFTQIRDGYRRRGLYSPIEQVDGRLKTISSILEKVQRKNLVIDEFEEKLDDIAGIRIICQFVEDIERVVEIIHQREDLRVISEKDYVSSSKDSGYRSYHMIILYKVHTIRGPREVKCEIQIRTLAMNFWATVEHSLQYKYDQDIPDEIRERLTNAADAIVVLDSEMSYVRQEIMDAQNSFRLKANVVSDILNNIQNLYKVSNKREILKIQDEFFRLYKSGNLKDLERFNKELDIISEGYRAQSLE